MRFRDFHKNIKIRIVETFMSSLIGSMIFPFMAIYLAFHFGAKVAGLLLVINVFIGIGISFVGGYFGDQFGRKKIMVFAETLRFAAFTTMALCNSPWFESPEITFMMMTINSICWGLAGPADQAMLIDVSTPEQRKFMYSITYWSSNLSIALGGIVGAFMFKHHLFELLSALSVMALVTSVLVIFFIDESYKPEVSKVNAAKHVIQLFTNYATVMRDRLFILFTAASILVLSMEFQLTNYIGIRLSDEMTQQPFLYWHINGVNMMGILRTENTIIVALLMVFITRLTGRFKDARVLVVSCVVYTIGYGIIAYSNNIWLLFAMMAMLTIAEVARVPVEQTYMSSLPPDNARSSYMAFGGLRFNLSMLISSLAVTAGAFLPPLVMAVLITCVGLAGSFLYMMITPGLESRKTAHEIDRAG
ncbi:MAG TPA: MFS transporter [Bacillales bacterium]|nr:MFS transporter [Bacillales bacterium]